MRSDVLYGQSISYFSQWLTEQRLEADSSSLTRDNVLGWLDELRARTVTAGAIRTAGVPWISCASDATSALRASATIVQPPQTWPLVCASTDMPVVELGDRGALPAFVSQKELLRRSQAGLPAEHRDAPDEPVKPMPPMLVGTTLGTAGLVHKCW